MTTTRKTSYGRTPTLAGTAVMIANNIAMQLCPHMHTPLVLGIAEREAAYCAARAAAGLERW